VTSTTGSLHTATLTGGALATTLDPIIVVPGRLWRSVVAIGDVFAAMGLVLCIPFAIVAIGTPIALFVRLLLWMFGLL
jgi:hypothetical protein